MSLRNPSQFSLWKEENIDASCLLKIRTNTENSPEKAFQVRRSGVHSRMLVALSGYTGIINKKLNDTTERLLHVRKTKIRRVSGQVIGKRKTMHLRKIKFLETEILNLKMQYLTWRQQFWRTKQRQAAGFVKLFGGSMIPQSYVFSVSEEFFLQEMPGESQIKERIEKLKTALQHVASAMNTDETSPFARDFEPALATLIGEGLSRIDPETKVVPVLPGENMFTRAVLQSEAGELIDTFIREAISNGFAHFASRAPQLCFQLIEPFTDLGPEAQGVALSLYHRVLVNRAYELYGDDVFDGHVPRICGARMRDFVMAPELKPEGDDEEYVRDVFLRDLELRPVIDSFTELGFLVDPIDILFRLKSAMTKVNEIARKRQCEENHIVAFDDMFGMLIGALIASDLAEPVSVYRRTTLLVGREAISSVLECAMLNFEALVIEIKSWDEKRRSV